MPQKWGRESYMLSAWKQKKKADGAGCWDGRVI